LIVASILIVPARYSYHLFREKSKKKL
jgi:hypothetical protein